MTAPEAPQQAAWTIESVLRWAADDFRQRGLESPRLDAELLLGNALGLSRVQLIVDAKRPLSPSELARFRDHVKRRRKREPVAYLLRRREFFGRSFEVDAHVLIPRPETELLVEVMLDRTRHSSLSARVLDLCTGSGCVAITAAKERPTTFVVATDLSADALAVARRNRERLSAYNVALYTGDLFAPLKGCSIRFDAIVSNPPYIPNDEIAELQADVRDFEPHLALAGGADGLDIVRRIISEAPEHLCRGGTLALEVGAGEADATVALMRSTGFVDVTATRDLAKIERVVDGRWTQ